MIAYICPECDRPARVRAGRVTVPHTRECPLGAQMAIRFSAVRQFYPYRCPWCTGITRQLGGHMRVLHRLDCVLAEYLKVRFPLLKVCGMSVAHPGCKDWL